VEDHSPVIGDKPIISQKFGEQRILGGSISQRCAVSGQAGVAIIGDMGPLPSEGKGHTFESCWVRHFPANRGDRQEPERSRCRRAIVRPPISMRSPSI
jgi:hypothetical protein